MMKTGLADNLSSARFAFSLMIAFGAVFGACDNRAQAVPILQLYIDGATYDTNTQTWVVSSNSFDLWVIGDVESFGTIYDVKLSAAVQTSEIGGGSSISLTPTTTSQLTDPSTPVAPTTTANFPSGDGAVPLMGSGAALPTHGIYDTGTSFYEWSLGDLTLTDSPIGDFIGSYPSSFPSSGQINVYSVQVQGFTTIHFDAYDHVVKGDNHVQYKFAPFSHDAAVVPEPGSLALMGTGLVGFFGYGLRRRRSRSPDLRDGA